MDLYIHVLDQCSDGSNVTVTTKLSVSGTGQSENNVQFVKAVGGLDTAININSWLVAQAESYVETNFENCNIGALDRRLMTGAFS